VSELIWMVTHFGCVEFVEQHGSTRSTRRAWVVLNSAGDAGDVINAAAAAVVRHRPEP